ncbi:MAG: hypothetical protein WEB13_02990 [Dehalococcoidia bacterium]
MALLSVARTDDGAGVTLECRAGAAFTPQRLERAADAVAAGLDPTLLDARPRAAVRVVFAVDALPEPAPPHAAAPGAPHLQSRAPLLTRDN